MFATNITRTSSRKIVTVGSLPLSCDQDDIIAFAMRAADESRSSLWGWRCGTQYDANGDLVAIVTLHTD